jgi:hypothetical protein
MKNILRYRSLEAFCRYRARTVGEDTDVWLEKANILGSLAAAEVKLTSSAVDAENDPPRQRASR